MPTGIYKRTPEMMVKVRRHLAMGHSKKARQKALIALKKNAESQEWRDRVSDATKKAIWRQETRRRMLRGIREHFKMKGSNFRGGNGQAVTPIVKAASKILEPKGYVLE